jgi:hypothetical protein
MLQPRSVLFCGVGAGKCMAQKPSPGAGRAVFNLPVLHPRFTVEADLERRAVLPLPRECPSAAEGGRGCRGASFQTVPEEAVHTDYQEVGPFSPC